jgi:serine/threonine protein kinase
MSDPRPSSASEERPGAAAAAAEQLTLPSSPERALDRIPRNFGRYRIIDRLGNGGMGAVVRAHDTERDRVVAL